MERNAGHETAPGPDRRRTLTALGLAAAGFVLALGAVIQAYALPVAARTSEVWYAYDHQLAYDFTAHVRPGEIYPDGTLPSSRLLRKALPVEPPVYRRVVMSALTDSLVLHLPYHFQADRPADLTVTYRVDGSLVVPNLWERPYPLLPEQRLELPGSDRVDLDELAVTLPVRELLEELARLSEELRVSHEQAEIRVQPVVTVEAAGLPEPVVAEVAPEILVYIRGITTAIELDEPTRFADGQVHSETRVVPNTLELLGLQLPVATLRRAALIVLLLLAGVLGLVLLRQWNRWRPAAGADLNRLGPSLIAAEGVELPPDVTIVEVPSARQLIALHLQTERPVIRVRETYYLLDGTTCYRLALGGGGEEAPTS